MGLNRRRSYSSWDLMLMLLGLLILWATSPAVGSDKGSEFGGSRQYSQAEIISFYQKGEDYYHGQNGNIVATF